jgi:hypothetical protein
MHLIDEEQEQADSLHSPNPYNEHGLINVK